MQMPQKLIMPQNGVYLTKAYIDGEEHFALTNVGINPTFVNHPYRIETHILNFDQDIYGNLLPICFLKKIRDEKILKTLTNCRNNYIMIQITQKNILKIQRVAMAQ